MAIMLGWAAAALIGGYLMLTRTDASGEPGIRSLDRAARRLLRKAGKQVIPNECG